MESWFGQYVKPYCLDKGVPAEELDYKKGAMSDKVIDSFASAARRAIVVFEDNP